MGRLVLWVLLGAAVLYFAAVGLLHTEQESLDTASSINATLSCCAGPFLVRGVGRDSEAAERCPEALRVLRGVAWGVGEPATQARHILNNCPAASLTAVWVAPKSPVAAATKPAASPAPAPAPAPAAAAVPAAKPATEPSLSATLRCEEFPPRCADGQPCPPYSRDALRAAIKSPDRGQLLRAWLCQGEAPLAPLREAAGLLRAKLPRFQQSPPRCGESGETEGEQSGDEAKPAAKAEAAAAAGKPAAPVPESAEVAEARAMLCELPWTSLLGRPRLRSVLECGRCQEAEDLSGDSVGPLPCTPGQCTADEAVCVLGLMQGLVELAGDALPDEFNACRRSAIEANLPALESRDSLDLQHARSRLEALRAGQKLDAAQWSELVGLAAAAEYGNPAWWADPPDKVHLLKGPRSIAREATAAEAQAARAQVQPLLPKLPGTQGGAFATQVRALRFGGPEETVVLVCDGPGKAPAQVLTGLFWIKAGSVVPLVKPELRSGQEAEISGDWFAKCGVPIDVADLDGDGTPEVVLRIDEPWKSSLEVLSLGEPAAARGTVTHGQFADPDDLPATEGVRAEGRSGAAQEDPAR